MPLVCCTFLFAPIQTFTLLKYAQIQGKVAPGSFEASYWTRLSDTPFTIMHLWFLHALLGLTIMLAVLAVPVRANAGIGRFVSGMLDRITRITRLPFWLGGLILLLPGAIVWALAPPPDPFFPMFFVNKAWLFAPFFLFGAAMSVRPELREWVIRRDPVAACGAGLFWLHAILSLAGAHLNRRTPVVEWLLLVAVTTLLAVGLHEIVRRSALLSLMFNGVSPGKFRKKAAEGLKVAG